MNVWRTRMNAWLSPIAAASPFSPNTISVLAVTLVMAAAVVLALAERRPLFFLLALPFIFIGGMLDALDGVVARVQGRTSALGDFLDHFFDRVADLALLSGWIIGAGIRFEIGLIVLILVSLHGYLGTQIEASFGVRNYDQTGRGEFVLALFICPLLAWTLSRMGILHTPYWSLTIADWATVLLGAGAAQGLVQRFRSGISLSRESR
jgi:phosphatidylglycerophosphate synthase